MTNSKKVLLVEDEQFIREMYAMILRKEGYEVIEAADGAVGLAEAVHGGFNVILLDLMMPNMDGLTFLEHMQKENPPEPNGPIIVMSNLAYDEAAEKAKSLGAIKFFVKADLKPKEIVKVIQDVTE